MEELISANQSDVVGRLAFKYMEMCKVDSSSDSESETNPRWSDVNNKACDSSAACKKLQRLTGQNYQQCLDPYDGSSEDSSSNKGGLKRQRHSGSRVKGRGRRSAVNMPCLRREMTLRELTDVQMRSSSESEPSPCRAVARLKVDLSDSGFNTRSSLNSPAVTTDRSSSSKRVQHGSSTRSPMSPDDCSSLHAAFSKRKFFPPSGDPDEGMQRKRPCISDMEVERE